MEFDVHIPFIINGNEGTSFGAFLSNMSSLQVPWVPDAGALLRQRVTAVEWPSPKSRNQPGQAGNR